MANRIKCFVKLSLTLYIDFEHLFQ